jgi:hypothetical protein
MAKLFNNAGDKPILPSTLKPPTQRLGPCDRHRRNPNLLVFTDVDQK